MSTPVFGITASAIGSLGTWYAYDIPAVNEWLNGAYTVSGLSGIGDFTLYLDPGVASDAAGNSTLQGLDTGLVSFDIPPDTDAPTVSVTLADPLTDLTLAIPAGAFYANHGGATTYGAPLTTELPDPRGGVVQYFERVRLRWNPNDGVTVDTIGADLLATLRGVGR